MSAREPVHPCMAIASHNLARRSLPRSHQYPAKAVILCTDYRARVLRGVHGGEWAGTELDFSFFLVRNELDWN
jgi:hypothetical protein